jgi:hypothetical protein
MEEATPHHLIPDIFFHMMTSWMEDPHSPLSLCECLSLRLTCKSASECLGRRFGEAVRLMEDILVVREIPQGICGVPPLHLRRKYCIDWRTEMVRGFSIATYHQMVGNSLVDNLFHSIGGSEFTLIPLRKVFVAILDIITYVNSLLDPKRDKACSAVLLRSLEGCPTLLPLEVTILSFLRDLYEEPLCDIYKESFYSLAFDALLGQRGEGLWCFPPGHEYLKEFLMLVSFSCLERSSYHSLIFWWGGERHSTLDIVTKRCVKVLTLNITDEDIERGASGFDLCECTSSQKMLFSDKRKLRKWLKGLKGL